MVPVTGPDGTADDGHGTADEPEPGTAPAPETAVNGEGGVSDLPVEDWPDKLPRWDDAYLNRVALRLAHHYDLERDYAVDGERFEL